MSVRASVSRAKSTALTSAQSLSRFRGDPELVGDQHRDLLGPVDGGVAFERGGQQVTSVERRLAH